MTLGVEMEEDAVHFPPQSITGCSCYDIGPRGRGRREEAIIWMFDQALKTICLKFCFRRAECHENLENFELKPQVNIVTGYIGNLRQMNLHILIICFYDKNVF